MVARLRADQGLTQEQLAKLLRVSFATVNRWEAGLAKPRAEVLRRLEKLAPSTEAAQLGSDNESEREKAFARRGRRGLRRTGGQNPSTKPMEQMLWDAACSIRGEKDAPKFKDFLLPLLFLKRLSDVFDDEIARLAESFGSREKALETAELDHSLVRFYLPVVARWGAISGRESIAWVQGERPRDIGEHLTKAVRAVAKQNPALSGVIDIEDFAAERNGERDINPAKLRAVVETFSDPRYRLGLTDVDPDFLGRCYEYLLRKFAEGSGQSAGEFFTPTNVGFLIAHLMRPQPGEECHDYACGSAGLLIKLQLVARELEPQSKVPLKLFGQELQAESLAVAQMNGIIHDMDIEMKRGDSMINPKFRNADGSLRTFDVVVANPMWNQPFAQDIYEGDPFERFREAGGATSGKGDWAWLQHTWACMSDRGRAAVVLDTGAVTRGSGSKNEDRERNIRKWFVDRDLIEGVIMLPLNLFYNTSAPGVVVVLNANKASSRRRSIVFLDASRRFEKGRPKNFIRDDSIKSLASAFLCGESADGDVQVVDADVVTLADYHLSPTRWVVATHESAIEDLPEMIQQLRDLSNQLTSADARVFALLEPLVALSRI